MNKNKLISVIASIVAISTFTGCDRVEPGYVGIKVNQWGSQKGVNDFPLVTGGVFYNPLTEDIYKFPTFMQNAVWDRASGGGATEADGKAVEMNASIAKMPKGGEI